MLVAVIAWGLGNILVKEMTIDGLNLAFYRLWFGVALTCAILVVAKHRPTMREIKLGAPAGVIFGVNMVLGFTAIRITTVADATLIGAIQPAVTLLLVGALFGERVGRWEITSTCVAIGGIAILIVGASSQPEWSLLGDALALTGVLLFTGYFLASKRIRESVATVAFMATVHIFAALVVTPVVLIHGLQFDALTTGDWARIVTIVFTSGVAAHTLINWAHPYVKATLSSILLLVTPVVSATAAWVILGESLTVLQVMGGLVTLTGIVAFALAHRAKGEAAEPLIVPVPQMPEPTTASPS
jgi:drug/metabolite transporter (DMT)-like permease